MNYKSGQALITLLVFMIIAITVTSAAVVMMILNSRGTYKFQDGEVALQIAESGAENAMLRILRDPSYTGEAGLTIGEGTANIEITNGDPLIATATGRVNNFVRKIEVKAKFITGLFTVLSWKEVF